MIGSRSESGTSLCLVVLPMTFVFGFAEKAGTSGELSLLTSGFRTIAFFAREACSAEGVAPLRAARALVVLVVAGTVGCVLTRAEALVAAAGLPDMVFTSSTYKLNWNIINHMTAFEHVMWFSARNASVY